VTEAPDQRRAQQLKQLIQAGTVTHRHAIDLVRRSFVVDIPLSV